MKPIEEQVGSMERLHPNLQAFIHREGWDGLRPIQSQAVEVIFSSQEDLIVSAPTSGGKTEAAFLPVLSQVLDVKTDSFQVLYVGPLKALINDQYARLCKMLEGTGLPVHRWHGDVDDHRKRLLRRNPGGVLLITPESMESSLINFGYRARQLYGNLQFIVIDELHSFIESERGMHLRSLLSRIAQITGRRTRIIALSATLGDMVSAQEFLNMDSPETVRVIQEGATPEREVHLKTILIDETVGQSGGGIDPLGRIAQSIHEEFANSTNLVFANSRRTVEALALRLKQLSGTLNDYRLHHGSLSRQIRMLTESALKSDEPVSAICTSTLELGIDIGAIEAVAQIDPPSTVSSLVQRVGRAGRRRGNCPVLHFYIRSSIRNREAKLTDLLFPELLRGIAMVRLMENGWLEPQNPQRRHLSTLIHQVLSVLKQNGGLPERCIRETLSLAGPFRRACQRDFAMLLSGLETHGLVNVDLEGYYVLSLLGERITSRPDFYAAFASPIELSVRNGSEEIGKVPTGFGLKEGDCILLDARRWEVQEIDWKKRIMWVTATRHAKPPVFLSDTGDVHARVHQEMRAVLRSTTVPPWLDEESIGLLHSARNAALHAGLLDSDVLVSDSGIEWFPWAGSCALRTLGLWAQLVKPDVRASSLSLCYPGMTLNDFQTHLSGLRQVDPLSLARLLPDRERQKFDKYVHPELLDRANAEDRLDLAAALEAVNTASGKHDTQAIDDFTFAKAQLLGGASVPKE